MGCQIRFSTWSQSGSHRRFYKVRGKFALKQTEYPVCRDYTGDTGLGFNIMCFLKQLPGWAISLNPKCLHNFFCQTKEARQPCLSL